MREFILEEEQQHLCCYCEKRISSIADKSHLEHIRPQDKFPALIDTYKNISVSCQTNNTCGKAKKNSFSDDFIVPTEDDPTKYLTHSPHGEIISIQNNDKGDYTIKLLNLNAPKLTKARRKLFIELDHMKDEIEDFEKYFNEFPTLINYFKETYCT